MRGCASGVWDVCMGMSAVVNIHLISKYNLIPYMFWHSVHQSEKPRIDYRKQKEVLKKWAKHEFGCHFSYFKINLICISMVCLFDRILFSRTHTCFNYI